MKVFDIVNESENEIEEGPLRFVKRKLGNQKAQLDYEIDQKVNQLYKQFDAVAAQDPKKRGMTAKSLSNYLTQKGFAAKPSVVMNWINSEPSLARTLKKAAGKMGKQLGKMGGPSGLTPDKKAPQKDPRQGELDLQSMYAEAILSEVDAELSGGQVKQVIKKFVQTQFQKQIGGRLGRDEYADDPQNIQQDPKKQQMVQQAIKDLEAMGYTITKNDGKKGGKGGFMKGFDAGSNKDADF